MSTLPSASTTPGAPRAALAPARRPVATPAGPGYALGFVLFLLVNAALFVRPGDLVPALAEVEIYQYLILACFAVSFPAVLAALTPENLEKRAIDVCVLLLLPAVALSLLPRGDLGEMASQCFVVFKIQVYYLLFVSLITTPGRLRLFIACQVLCVTVVVLLAAMDFHKLIELPRPQGPSGRPAVIEANRMYGPGHFSDPNDICVLLVTALMLVLGRLADRRAGLARWLWLPCLVVFAYGFYRTGSRGGLLALVAGLGLLIRLRFGWWRAILLGAVGLPVLLALLGGRQAQISTTTNTGMERIWLWSNGLVMLRASPIFGVGWGHYAELSKMVAHNSYLHALAEMGLLGGPLFLGAFYLAVWGLYRLCLPVRDSRNQPIVPRIVQPELAQLYPYLGGALIAYATGMMTLALVNLVTTYTMLGMACVFQGMVVTNPPHKPLRFDLLMPARFVGLSLLFLLVMFLFVRFSIRI